MALVVPATVAVAVAVAMAAICQFNIRIASVPGGLGNVPLRNPCTVFYRMMPELGLTNV